MIEIPRAALTADEIAEVADFFSFGTNDLTQMTFGYRATTSTPSCPTTSREHPDHDPFQSSTRTAWAAGEDGRRARAARPSPT
jgi:pyruvate,orthophosphate dikinase